MGRWTGGVGDDLVDDLVGHSEPVSSDEEEIIGLGTNGALAKRILEDLGCSSEQAADREHQRTGSKRHLIEPHDPYAAGTLTSHRSSLGRKSAQRWPGKAARSGDGVMATPLGAHSRIPSL